MKGVSIDFHVKIMQLLREGEEGKRCKACTQKKKKTAKSSYPYRQTKKTQIAIRTAHVATNPATFIATLTQR